MEILIEYLLSSQAEFQVARDIRTIDAQIDLIARNLHIDNPLLTELGTYVPVEAKNWQSKVGASEVRNFISKVRSGSCHSGILVSRQGVSGVVGNTDAVFAIRKYYHRDNVVVMVVDENDIGRVVNGQLNVLDLLVERYERVRFDLR